MDSSKRYVRARAMGATPAFDVENLPIMVNKKKGGLYDWSEGPTERVEELINSRLLRSHEARRMCGIEVRQNFHAAMKRVGMSPIATTPTGFYLWKYEDVLEARNRIDAIGTQVAKQRAEAATKRLEKWAESQKRQP